MDRRGMPGRVLLQELIPDVPCPPGLRVSGLSDSGSSVRRGEAYLAPAGVRRHGIEFALEAQDRGAVAVVFEPEGARLPDGLTIPALAVPRLTERLGEIAARFYGHPSRAMEVIGITGTNGKTSCSFFLAQALGGAVLGTLGWGSPAALQATRHTTAPALENQKRLAALRARGIRSVAMEVSSHALDQGRVNGIDFDLALWTNLSRDHLDYHGTPDAYADAKIKLLSRPKLKAAILNLDDPAWPAFHRGVGPGVRIYGFSAFPGKDTPFPRLVADAVCYRAAGMEFQVTWKNERMPVQVPLLGEFNLANVLAVLMVLLARGVVLAEAVRLLANLEPVPGRMECFRSPARPLAVVDYAHTPAALELALRSLRRHCRGRLWVVFGCGGQRDRGKRPQMGRVAEGLADRVILSDDNPRAEDGDRIVAEIMAGMTTHPRVVRDRGEAIATAIASADVDDIVLVAGKGHESWQEIGGERRAFCDRTVVAELLGEAPVCA
ncbi:MAG: UDP-N-acetylmuramoyl-L-alanyl-D-glutamate--2,6-diaminopimelate ligase [Methylohalobius sp. ZOD2]